MVNQTDAIGRICTLSAFMLNVEIHISATPWSLECTISTTSIAIYLEQSFGWSTKSTIKKCGLFKKRKKKKSGGWILPSELGKDKIEHLRFCELLHLLFSENWLQVWWAQFIIPFTCIQMNDCFQCCKSWSKPNVLSSWSSIRNLEDEMECIKYELFLSLQSDQGIGLYIQSNTNILYTASSPSEHHWSHSL